MINGKQIIFDRKGHATLVDAAVRQPRAGEIVIENKYTVISAGTERADLLQLPNTEAARQGYPYPPGYSGAGRVCAVGDEVDRFAIGDRVIVNWGGHRSHTVKVANDTVKIDDDSIDLVDAAFAPIAAFPLLGVRKLKIELGESAMVVGLGILGSFAVQMAALSGAIPVLALDFDADRRTLALKLGATAAFAPDDVDLIDKIKQATGGGGPNTVVEVSGSAAALQQSLQYIAWQGRVSLLGCTRVSDAPIDYYKYVHKRGISLIGAHTHTRTKYESAPGNWTEQDDYRTFLKLIGDGKLQTRPLISKMVSPDDASSVYAGLAEAELMPLGIVFDWSAIR